YLSLRIPPPPRSTLFPYTTLFRSIHHIFVITGIERTQSTVSRIATIGFRWGVLLHHVPELTLKLNDVLDKLVITFDAVHLQLLTTNQHGYVRSLLPCHSQLVLHLAAHVIWYTFGPVLCASDARGFALQYLHLITAHDSSVEVG